MALSNGSNGKSLKLVYKLKMTLGTYRYTPPLIFFETFVIRKYNKTTISNVHSLDKSSKMSILGHF
jgi:hypothetical protein